ncbi:TRAP transporter substrate-binding protein [Hydrogenophaga aquatica]
MNPRTPLPRLAAALAATVLAAGAAQAQTTTLTLSSWVPPTHYVVKDILQPWMEDVKKATDGRVVINLLPKPVGAPAQHWELARKGVADITWGNFTYEPERFKHVWFAELPMMGSNAEATSVALWRTYTQFLAGNEAFKGVVVLGTGMLGGGQFHHPGKSIQMPDDLKGQKVRMGGPIQKRLLEDLGAVPVSGPGTKAYELLEGGVIDASLHPLESVVNFRLDGKLRHHTIVPEGLYDAAFFIAINEGKFKRLSDADQQAVLKVSGEALARRWGQEFDRQNRAAEARMRSDGHVFTQPNAALLERIRKVRTELLKELAADAPSFGVKDHNAMVTFYENAYKAQTK